MEPILSNAQDNSVAVDLPTLTSLRFFAAAMIFVYHMREFQPSVFAYAIAPGMNHGVSFFFVLCGFVLTYAYDGREVAWGRFYLARAARIVPLHIAALVLLFAAMPLPVARGQNTDLTISLISFTLKATLLDSWVPVRAFQSSWNSVSWSLSVEMAFYAAFPFLLRVMIRRPLATLAVAAAVPIGVFAAGTAAGVPVFTPEREALTLYRLVSFFPPSRAFEFALGMATCLAWRRWIAPMRLSFADWTAIEATALAGSTAWLIFAVPPLVDGASGLAFVWLAPSGSCLVFAALLAAVAKGRGGLGRLLSLRPMVALGEVSFAFYLVHGTVMRALRYNFGAGPGALSAFALSLALAFLLHEAVGKPMRARVLAWGSSEAGARQSKPHPSQGGAARADLAGGPGRNAAL